MTALVISRYPPHQQQQQQQQHWLMHDPSCMPLWSNSRASWIQLWTDTSTKTHTHARAPCFPVYSSFPAPISPVLSHNQILSLFAPVPPRFPPFLPVSPPVPMLLYPSGRTSRNRTVCPVEDAPNALPCCHQHNPCQHCFIPLPPKKPSHKVILLKEATYILTRLQDVVATENASAQQCHPDHRAGAPVPDGDRALSSGHSLQPSAENGRECSRLKGVKGRQQPTR